MSADDDRLERLERLPERLPFFGDELPGAHVSLHAVLVHDGGAWFDDEAIHGHSSIERGVEWVESREALEAPERWGVVWVAVTHGPEGMRAYTGLAADAFWLDRHGRRGAHTPGRHAERMDTAMRGRVAVEELSPAERAAVRQALLMRDPEAWDRADASVQDALRPGTDGSRTA